MEANASLVSVIIPSKNRPEFVLKTIESVIAQTYQNIEIIVVDDGSKTLLAPLLEKAFGDLLRCVRHDCSKGAPAARNTGANYAKGEYIAFLDDDDEWLSDKIEKQMSAFLKLGDEFGVVYCGYDYVVVDKIIPRLNIYHDVFDLSVISLRGCPVGSPTPIMRRIYFEKIGGFDVGLPACQDWDLWIRLSRVCKFYPVKESLALYRVHGEQISVDISKKILAREAIFNKHINDLFKYSKILSMHYRHLGSLCVLIDQYSDSRMYLLKSVKTDWSNWGSWIHIFLQSFAKRFDKYLINKYGITQVGNVRLIN